MTDPIPQPGQPGPAAFMARALALADFSGSSGEGTGYGAVIVKGGRIVGEGWNRIHARNDPTAHGEVEAIRDACRRLGTPDLSGCVIYLNGGRPCPMCATACYWAGLGRIYYGNAAHAITDAGPPAYTRC
jgi:tRNA(Arg) A34 adenosine deaminase TadA